MPGGPRRTRGVFLRHERARGAFGDGLFATPPDQLRSALPHRGLDFDARTGVRKCGIAMPGALGAL
eukprot:11226787-Lingulodinium_polyedra.AAC.1